MATERATTEAGPIRLNFRTEQRVLVEPADENRFVMTVKEVIRACESAQQGEDNARERFEKLLVYLNEWCQKHSGTVKAAYVHPGYGFLNILICTHGSDYQFDFDDAITALDVDLVREFEWLCAEVLQVPETAREGHLSLQKAILVYGDGSRTLTASNA